MKKLAAIMIIFAVLAVMVTPAMAQEGSTNVALNKATSQSTTDHGGLSDRAVDGNTDGDYSHNSVTHTNSGENPWWEVDLGEETHIHKIRIWNRTDCCGDRLNDFYVFVSDSPFLSTDPYVTAAQANVKSFYIQGSFPDTDKIMVNVPGKFVRIQIPGAGEILSLAEVEVFKLDDAVAPAGTIAYSPAYSPETWTNQAVEATLSTTKAVTITNNDGSPTYTFHQNGSFTFTFVDGFGNEGSAAAAVDYIDRAAPVTTDDAPEWAQSEVTVSLTASDSGSGVQATYYEWNGETQIGTAVYLVGEGAHELKYWSVDKAGNIEEPREITVHILPRYPLAGLSLSEGFLDFYPDTALYTMPVPSDLGSLTLTPVAASDQISIRINGQPAESGSGRSIPLETGGNTITVALFAPGDGWMASYTIMVMRPSSGPWNIIDTVRAMNAGFDMNDDGGFNVQDVVELLRFIQPQYPPLSSY